MIDDPLGIMRELAKRFQGRISSINLQDANVCTWTHPPGRSWESTIVSGEPFSKQLRYAHRGHKIRMFANRYFLNAEVTGSFAMEHLSINKKNENNFMLKAAAEALRINEKQYCTFTKSGTLTARHRNLFARAEFKAFVRELDLHDRESLHFAADSTSVYFEHPSFSRVTNAIESLINLADSIEEPEEELDLSVLPVQFHPLIPLIKKWAIGDDSDREDFLAAAPAPVLRILIDEVDPYLKVIDSYLDSFREGPPTEQAAALGRLAESALEAKQHLSDKNGSRTR